MPETELSTIYYEALGRMVVAFQSLEETIMFSLVRLTRLGLRDDIDMPYVYALSELSFKSKLKLLRNYLEKAEPQHFLYLGCPKPKERAKVINELLDRMKKSATEAESLEEQRNQLIHSVWRPSESNPEDMALRFKLRVQSKRVSLANHEVSKADVLDLVERMIETTKSLSSYSELLASALIEKRKNAA